MAVCEQYIKAGCLANSVSELRRLICACVQCKVMSFRYHKDSLAVCEQYIKDGRLANSVSESRRLICACV